MRIKSITDIITNSSSECYQIKNSGISEGKFQEMWNEELVKRGVFDESGNYLDEFCKDNLEHTLRGLIYSEDGYLYLDFPSMCNIDFSIREVLEGWFGVENVEYVP